MLLSISAECRALLTNVWLEKQFHKNCSLNKNAMTFFPDVSHMKNANFTTSYYLKIIMNKIMTQRSNLWQLLFL